MRGILLFATVLSVGCYWTLNDPGTDPLPKALYFPTGISMDPGGQYAYVANANGDLRYGGGTVQIIDMNKFDCVVAYFNHPWGPNDPMAMVCPYDVANLKKTARCQPDPLVPTIVDCDSAPFILDAVKVGNFAGEIKVRGQAGAGDRQLFVAVRGDPSITEIDVKFAQGTPSLNCFDGPRPTTNPPSCAVSHLIQKFDCPWINTPTLPCMPGNDSNSPTTQQLPPEPFGMELDDTTGRLVVSHLSSGQVSVIDPDTRTLVSVSQPFFPSDSAGRHGAFAIAKQPPPTSTPTPPMPPPPTPPTWYMTSNIQPLIATFRLTEVGVVVPGQTFAVPSFSNGADIRDIAFDTLNPNRLFVTDNAPGSLVNIDVAPLPPSAGGGTADQVTDIVQICQTPSHFKTVDLGNRQTKVLVSCFLSSQVMVVDPDRPGVDASVLAGLRGPNEIDFNFNNLVTPPVTPPAGQRAYVTNFTDSTISAIDLDLNSPTKYRVVARLGFPNIVTQ
jgi:hypothetical protein